MKSKKNKVKTGSSSTSSSFQKMVLLPISQKSKRNLSKPINSKSSSKSKTNIKQKKLKWEKL